VPNSVKYRLAKLVQINNVVTNNNIVRCCSKKSSFAASFVHRRNLFFVIFESDMNIKTLLGAFEISYGPNETIHQLEKRIAFLTGLSVGQFHLIFQGLSLSEESCLTLSQYKIKQNSVLNLILHVSFEGCYRCSLNCLRICRCHHLSRGLKANIIKKSKLLLVSLKKRNRRHQPETMSPAFVSNDVSIIGDDSPVDYLLPNETNNHQLNKYFIFGCGNLYNCLISLNDCSGQKSDILLLIKVSLESFYELGRFLYFIYKVFVWLFK
jgi:hypothetical protein